MNIKNFLKLKLKSNIVFNKNTKKAISPVVAMALLLVLVVISTVGFQNWFVNFSSKVFVDVETQTEQKVGTVSIETLIGNSLFINNKFSENYSLNSIKVGNVDCELNKNLSLGVNEIDISSCTNNLDSQVNEVVIVTETGTSEKSFYMKDVEVSVVSPPKVNFVSDKNNVAYGESVNLTWNSTNADSCEASGDWSGSKIVANSEIVVNLISSKTFTLTCEGSGGSISKTVSVVVGSQDITPDSFAFTDLNNQEVSSQVTSDSIVVNGFDGPITATISGDGNPLISKNGGAYNSSIGGFNPGDSIQIKVNLSEGFAENLKITLVIGDFNVNWTVTSRSANDCSLDGLSVVHGNSAMFYSFTAPSGVACSSVGINRICNDGVLSGDNTYKFKSCLSGCSQSGVNLYNGQSYSFYSASASYSCSSQSRTCNNGVLSGSYIYTSCSTKRDGVCGSGSGVCTVGSRFSDNGQTSCGTTRTWRCQGVNGGSASGTCSYSNGACCLPAGSLVSTQNCQGGVIPRTDYQSGTKAWSNCCSGNVARRCQVTGISSLNRITCQ